MTTATNLRIGTSFSALEHQVGTIEAGLRALEPLQVPTPPALEPHEPGSRRIATVLVILVSAALLGPLLL